MTTHELAWLAGFIDGEGTIRVGKHISKRGYQQWDTVLSAANTHKPTLEWIQGHLGGGVYKVCKSPQGNRRVAWAWKIVGKQAVDAVGLLLPYLITKKKQAEVIIAFYKTRGFKRKTPFDRVPDNVTAERTKLAAELKELNRRGCNVTGTVTAEPSAATVRAVVTKF